MHVLVATDGSKYGHWGLNWVATLPFLEPPQVTALHVLDLRGPRRPLIMQASGEHDLQKEIQRMETCSANTIKKATQQMASLKLTGTAREERGAVESVILKHAPKRDGLLVVGSHDRDILDRFMLGSVSAHLIQHAPCPVLVIKGTAKPLRRICLATDGSSASTKALTFVLRKFRPDGSTGNGGRMPIHVSVIHVMPLVMYPGLKDAGDKIIEQNVRKLVDLGFTAEPVCRFGVPADEIMKAASKEHADLIVMGTRGLSAIAQVFLGSVSTGVVHHASCTVLVVR
jgi:nucleotide-binding universal stress UspA family protein